MPVLLLSPRFSDDSIALATEASRLSWRVHRLHDRRPPARLAEEEMGEREELSRAGFDLEAARAFASDVLMRAGELFPPAVVLDVGRIEGHGWAVVELNPAWNSGLYACDPAGVLRVLLRASGTLRTSAPRDARWLRPLPDVEG